MRLLPAALCCFLLVFIPAPARTADAPLPDGPASDAALPKAANPASAVPRPPAAGRTEPAAGSANLENAVAKAPAPDLPLKKPATGPAVGVFVSPTGILLRQDSQTGQWMRVAPRATLAAGDRLLSLPTYRPAIALTSGITVHVGGGTSIDLLAPDASGTPGIEVQYGRLVLQGGVDQGEAGNRLRLKLGDQVTAVTFANAD